jgi:hypothetical protein
MIPTKDVTPHVPVSVAEIVEDVHRAAEMRITMVPLHARDEPTGKPTPRADVYARMIEGIRRFTPDPRGSCHYQKEDHDAGATPATAETPERVWRIGPVPSPHVRRRSDAALAREGTLN